MIQDDNVEDGPVAAGGVDIADDMRNVGKGQARQEQRSLASWLSFFLHTGSSGKDKIEGNDPGLKKKGRA